MFPLKNLACKGLTGDKPSYEPVLMAKDAWHHKALLALSELNKIVLWW